MSATRRVFPEAFKREAVDRVATSGLSAGFSSCDEVRPAPTDARPVLFPWALSSIRGNLLLSEESRRAESPPWSRRAEHLHARRGRHRRPGHR